MELSHLYKNFGEHEKAALLADTAPDLSASKPFLRINAFDGKEAVAASGEALIDTLLCATELMAAIVRTDRNLPPETAAMLLGNAIAMFGLVFSEGDFGKLSGTMATLHMLRSYYLWLSDEKEAAFAALDAALACAKTYDDEAGVRAYASPLLRYAKPIACSLGRSLTAELPKLWPWWDVPGVEEVKHELHADPRWTEWVRKTAEA